MARAGLHLRTGRASRRCATPSAPSSCHPHEAEFVDTRAHVYEALGRAKDAIADFRQALTAEPSMQSAAKA